MNYFALYENINPKSKSTAGAEILLMLAGAYLLGYVTHWLLCRYSHLNRNNSPARTNVPPVVRSSSRQAVAPLSNRSVARDDLTIIEGIGPRIQELLQNGGIRTFAELAAASVPEIKAILDKAGPRFQMHNPGTWARQSALARDGMTKELEALKSKLTAGK